MPNITYGASLLIVIHHPVNGKPDGRVETLRFPVRSFSVSGGADRRIDLTSTNESLIASEFEQARIYSNIIFFIQPSNDAPTNELINLSKSDKKNFTISFQVSVRDEAITLRMISLQSHATNFVETPVPVGGTPPLLKARFTLSSPDLAYGQRDEKLGHIVLKPI